MPVRLDKVVVDLPEVGSRSRARRVIDEGKVSVDGAVCRDPGRMLEGTEDVTIAWNRAGTSSKKVAAGKGLTAAGLSILYEDDWLLALDKPAGLLTDAASTDQRKERDTLRKRAAAWLRAHGRDAFVVHRIDRDTTGVVLLCKDADTAAKVTAQFHARTPERVYDVVVHGRVDADAEWVDFMAWDKKNRVQRPCGPDHPDAWRAVSHMRVIARGAGATRLEVRLESGRRNQIRLQAMLRGHPLIGERLYVPDGWRAPRTPTMARQALHARRLGITHPHSERSLVVEAPWPDDFRALVRGLG